MNLLDYRFLGNDAAKIIGGELLAPLQGLFQLKRLYSNVLPQVSFQNRPGDIWNLLVKIKFPLLLVNNSLHMNLLDYRFLGNDAR